MNNLRNYIQMNDKELNRFKTLYEQYKLMFNDPENSSPKFIINVPTERYTWEEMLDDPHKMLKSQFNDIQSHSDIGDDKVPTVRVNFGTAQFANAYGCDFFYPEDDVPCARNHVLTDSSMIEMLQQPNQRAGIFKKLEEWTEIFLDNLPEGVQIQHPDIQSPFNNAHLVRGNDILLDFYDCPERVDLLLQKITDYMISQTKWVKSMVSDDEEWFFDWGSLWKGSARLSNCSLHMVGPEVYEQTIKKHDQRFLDAIGGGRLHYCGSPKGVIEKMFDMPNMYGIDFDSAYHDILEISEKTPKHIVLSTNLETNSKLYQDIIETKVWPFKKRNMVFMLNANSKEEAQNMLSKLREISN